MEKLTDFNTLKAYESAFGRTYHTEGNADLFGSKYPDGWDWLNKHTLLIIENKSDVSKSKIAQQQLSAYCANAMNHPDVQTIVAVNGFGNKSNFVYHIYEFTAQGKLNKLDGVNDFNDLRRMYPDEVKNEQTDTVTLQTLHNLLVKETGIDGAKELSIFCAFLILASNLPSIRKLLAQCDEPKLLFTVIMGTFETFYGADPIVKRLLMTPKLETANMLQLLRIASTLQQTSLTTLFKQFCKYTKTKQDKNIELTPPYIIAVMKKLLEEYEYTSVIDPFAGSSEFLLHVKSDAQKTAYEINEYMYLLSKINLTINHVKGCDLQCCDMSKTEFMADVCITNPPYTKAISGRHAIGWLTLLIDRVNVIIAIIPTTNISDAKQFIPYKKALLDAGYKPRKVINCGKCFKGIGVDASILVMDNDEETTPIQIFDMNFVNKIDVVRPPRNEMKFLEPAKKKIQNTMNGEGFEVITEYDENTDWTKVVSTNTFNVNDVRNQYIQQYEEQLISQVHAYLTGQPTEPRFTEVLEAVKKNIQSDENASDIIFNETDDMESLFETVRIGDIFETIKGPTRQINNQNAVQTFPVISASAKNKGITQTVTDYDYDENCLSVACNGSCGYTFHQSGKFSRTSDVKLLKLKQDTPFKDEIYNIFAKFMTPQLSQSYSFSNKLSEEKLLNETIQIPKELFERYLKSNELYAFKISDMFDIIPGKSRNTADASPSGKYPYISAGKHNNGIAGYFDDYDYNCHAISVVCDGNGACGYAFHQSGKFSKSPTVRLIKLKQHHNHDNELYELFAKCITAQLSPKYSYTNKLNTEKLLSETIQIPSNAINPLVVLPTTEMRTFKIGDMFEIVKGPKRDVSTSKPGEYPLISATTKNNGVTAHIDTYDYDTNCLTVANVGDGGAGYAFHQSGKFSITGNMKIIRFKQHYDHEDELYELFAKCITAQLSPKYSHHNVLSNEKILNETIQIPSNLVEPLLTQQPDNSN